MATTHPTHGELRAYLDDESGEAEGRTIHEHLEACAPCRDAAAGLRTREEEVRRLLSHIDPPPRTEAALRSVQARLSRARRSPSFATARISLAKAALLVLFLGAGVGAAIPGSPVRSWLGAAWSTLAGGDPLGRERPEAAAGPRDAPAAPTPAGVRVDPSDGRVRIELSGAGAGTALRVRLTDRPDAGVSAPAGVRFSSGEGTIRAVLDGGESGGTVEVDLPRGASAGQVVVDGRVYLRIRAGRVELPGPEPRREGEGGYRFVVPAPSGPGDPAS